MAVRGCFVTSCILRRIEQWPGLVVINVISEIENDTSDFSICSIPSRNLSNIVLGDLPESVARDSIEAYKWFTLSLRQKHEDAKTNRDLLVTRMTEDQIAEGEWRAAQFVPKEDATLKGRVRSSS